MLEELLMKVNSKNEHSAYNHVAEGFPQFACMRMLTTLVPSYNMVLASTAPYILYFMCVLRLN